MKISPKDELNCDLSFFILRPVNLFLIIAQIMDLCIKKGKLCVNAKFWADSNRGLGLFVSASVCRQIISLYN